MCFENKFLRSSIFKLNRFYNLILDLLHLDIVFEMLVKTMAKKRQLVPIIIFDQ